MQVIFLPIIYQFLNNYFYYLCPKGTNILLLPSSHTKLCTFSRYIYYQMFPKTAQVLRQASFYSSHDLDHARTCSIFRTLYYQLFPKMEQLFNNLDHARFTPKPHDYLYRIKFSFSLGQLIKRKRFQLYQRKNYASRLALLPFQGKRSNASLG